MTEAPAAVSPSLGRIEVFMVEQNASLALQIAHFAYILQSGRIMLSGPAKELLEDPQRLSRRGSDTMKRGGDR